VIDRPSRNVSYLKQIGILQWSYWQTDFGVIRYSAVTILVVTIFIAIFQNYLIVFLLRYALCKHDRFTTSLLKFQHQSRAANDVTRVIAARWPWLSSVSIRERRRNFLWNNVSQVVSVARAVFMTLQLTITSVCLCDGFQVSVVCSVWMEN